MRYDVSASCEEVGTNKGDAAYDLCGTFTAEEFCTELLKTLRDSWGLTNAGACQLNIRVVVADWRDLGEGPFATREEAERFALAEVGVQWRIEERADGFHIGVPNRKT
jgi:hypothetical protein